MEPVNILILESGLRFDPTCLDLPIETLLHAQDDPDRETISSYDCVEAYNLLVTRIRLASNSLSHCDQESTLQEKLTTLIPQLTRCMARDLSEVLNFYLDFETPELHLSSVAAVLEPRLEEDHIQSAIETSLLCQSAISLASVILSLPGINTFFSDRDKSALLDPIIGLCAERYLRVYNSVRLQTAAFLCLRANATLGWITPEQSSAIVGAVNSALERDDGDELKMSALKTVHHFLTHNAERFVRPFSAFFPKILVHLANSMDDGRYEGALALCAFASAKMTFQAPDTFKGFSSEIQDFMDHHGTRKKSVNRDYLLPALLQNTFQKSQCQEPVMALVSVAALIILEDAPIFSHPKSIRVVLDAMRYTSRHKVEVVRKLHTEVWKCLIWALSRILDDAGLQRESQEEWSARRDTYERAFKTLMQEVRPGVGLSLVSVALQEPPDMAGGKVDDFVDWNVGEALEVVKLFMKQREESLFLEGYSILSRWMSGIGSSDGNVPALGAFNFIQKPLVDGTWLRMNEEQLNAALNEIDPVDVSMIRPLTEAEINAHFQDLSDLWVFAGERFQKDCGAERLEQLASIWQALLLCQANLTQGQNHLTASRPVAAQLANLITRFVTPIADSRERVVQLGLVKKWWHVLKNVFEPSFVSIPAEIVLAGILSRDIDLKVGDVRRVWDEVCSDLVEAGVPTLLHVLHTRVTRVTMPAALDEDLEKLQEKESISATRAIWAILGKVGCVGAGMMNHEGTGKVRMGWGDMAAFLAVPFHCDVWELEDDEEKLWVDVCDAMITASRGDGMDDEKALRHVMSLIGQDRRDIPMIIVFDLGVRLSLVRMCRKMLPEMCALLSRTYAAAEKHVGTKAIAALGRFWAVEDDFEVVSSIANVQSGIAPWLVDEKRLLSDDEQVTLASTGYTRALQRLRALTSNYLGLLSRLEMFLVSAFKNSGSSAAGPDAFLDFWHDCYEGIPRLAATCPAELFGYLKGYAEVCGRSIADDSSVTSASPSTVISDSQSPVSPMAGGSQMEYLRFADLAGLVSPGLQDGLSPSQIPGLGMQHDRGRKSATPEASNSSVSAMGALKQYGDTSEEQREVRTTPTPSFRSGDMSNDLYWSRDRKAPKRHHTEAEFDFSNKTSMGDNLRPLKRSKTSSGIPSSPIVPATSSPPREHSPAPEEERINTKSRSPSPASSDMEDDYDAWETGISNKDVQRLQGGLAFDEEDEELETSRDEDDDEEADFGMDDTKEVFLSPTVSEFAFRSRRRERSQTAPEPDNAPGSPLLFPEQSAQPLKRHHTSGESLPDGCAQLEALQEAYAAVVERNGVSQMGVEELLRLKRLTSRIAQTVDEHIEQELDREGMREATPKI